MSKKYSVILIIFIVIIAFSIFIVPRINNSNNEINRAELYLQTLTDQVKSAYKEYNLDGEPQLIASDSYGFTRVFNILIASDQFESKAPWTKVSILDVLGKIAVIDFEKEIKYKIGDVKVSSQGNEYLFYGDTDEVIKNGESFPPPSPNTSNANRVIIGSWFDSNSSTCHDIVIEKLGSFYIMTTTCNDGSSGTTSLTAKVINGEERLYGNGNSAVGDYMVIESSGYLGFYDNQGLIFEASPR
jgi:hypothetical protein